ncbi:hypothetical protein P7K49_036753 [Saguinus oedipus]|uniref:WDR59/RTC1-like RING zinc finger domain-containing protein n=1 Tax=Saguinus oedipus TaxID=9490 RepID=A0ABQ9TL37_SAGOE|nr:hypothetical protein P7K49_036753 [Saguinus oedipus]
MTSTQRKPETISDRHYEWIVREIPKAVRWETPCQLCFWEHIPHLFMPLKWREEAAPARPTGDREKGERLVKLDDMGLQQKEFGVYCSHCRSEVRGTQCAICKGFTFQCAICHVAVRGSSNFCLTCGHGGHTSHMMEWFRTQEAVADILSDTE